MAVRTSQIQNIVMKYNQFKLCVLADWIDEIVSAAPHLCRHFWLHYGKLTTVFKKKKATATVKVERHIVSSEYVRSLFYLVCYSAVLIGVDRVVYYSATKEKI